MQINKYDVTIVKFGIVQGMDTEIEKMGVPVLRTYKNNTIITRIMRKLKRVIRWLNVDCIYNDSLRKIDTSIIILYDSVDSVADVEYLRKYNPKHEIIVWYRNPVKHSANPLDLDGANAIWSYSETESKKYNMNYHLPFYIADKSQSVSSQNSDVLFIGIDKGRYDQIIECKQIFEDNNLSTDFNIVPDHPYQKHKRKEYVSPIPYTEIIKKINHNKCILDLYVDTKTGLSFRPMEAMFFKKKLITNHALICNEPFYSSENIFVLGKDSIEDIENFCKSDYKDIDSKIVMQYSFEKWLDDIREFRYKDGVL